MIEAPQIADPTGFPLWTSRWSRSSTHDITAAREHCLGALYPTAAAGLPTLADKGYQGAGIGVHEPIKGRHLGVDNRTYNTFLTGMRAIGELCALRRVDVDLEGERPTLTVAGTVTQVKGKGLIRQPVPKTDAGHRTVMLPSFVVTVLLRRSVAVPAGDDSGLVFPSSAFTLRPPHNLRGQLRDAKGEGLGWVTPHTLRRSAATAIDGAMGTDAAAAQLGHASPSVTGLHYVERAAMAPDLTAVLEQFAGATGNDNVG